MEYLAYRTVHMYVLYCKPMGTGSEAISAHIRVAVHTVTLLLMQLEV